VPKVVSADFVTVGSKSSFDHVAYFLGFHKVVDFVRIDPAFGSLLQPEGLQREIRVGDIPSAI